jgi:hypothetical protein
MTLGTGLFLSSLFLGVILLFWINRHRSISRDRSGPTEQNLDTTRRLSKRRRILAVFVAVLACVSVVYWYVYGRERDLFESTEVEGLGKEVGKYLKLTNVDDNDSKRLSDLLARRSEVLSTALNGRLGLTSNGTGSTLHGSFLSTQENWITNRVYVHVRIMEKRHCGEKLQNMFSDIDWEKNCVADPTHTVMDTVDGQSYQCFVGAVEYGKTALCHASTIVPFDASKQTWDFFFSKVTGHPEDPLGLFK